METNYTNWNKCWAFENEHFFFQSNRIEYKGNDQNTSLPAIQGQDA